MKRYLLRSTAALFIPCLFSAGLLLLSGCSSIKVVETWSKPATAGHHYRKLMILGIADDQGIRRLAENILVDELGRSGIMAVASHTVVKDLGTVKRDDIIQAVRSAGADAVLTIRPVSKGDTTVVQAGQSGGIYGTATNVGGSYVAGGKSYALATLQTNLYDTATTELVWSATIDTYDARSEARVSRDLARFFAERLRRDGLL